MSNFIEKLIRESLLLTPDSSSFKRQESTFIILNLVVLAALLLIHTLFSRVLGNPPRTLLLVLAAGFLVYAMELIWIQGATARSEKVVVFLTWATIALNMTLAFALASLSYRQDTQYFALLVAPILLAAFRFSFGSMILVVFLSSTLEVFWVWNFYRLHPPTHVTEYMEAGTVSLIYASVGILVWVLVNHLHDKEVDLRASLARLEQARERLLTEEKLAAVGRFSVAIAHEIRNPVAMISSALATAFTCDLDSIERQAMFEIAAKEAQRLEKLTTDFLVYARPRQPARQYCDVFESIAYIADICRPNASEKSVTIRTEPPQELFASIDSGQIQQCLLNLVMNAIDASEPGGVVNLRGSREDKAIRVDIVNAHGPISHEHVDRIFEPFFTTKPAGTGLGLAIARNIARGHGGDLVLSQNRSGSVQFSVTLPQDAAPTGTL